MKTRGPVLRGGSRKIDVPARGWVDVRPGRSGTLMVQRAVDDPLELHRHDWSAYPTPPSFFMRLVDHTNSSEAVPLWLGDEVMVGASETINGLDIYSRHKAACPEVVAALGARILEDSSIVDRHTTIAVNGDLSVTVADHERGTRGTFVAVSPGA